MSSNILLYSNHCITEEELAEVILQSDGILTPEPETRSFGGIIDGSTYIWIDEKEFSQLEKAKLLLGGELQTWIYIALDSSPTLERSGSLRLAVRFAHTCCQHWPCVVDNDRGRLFSCQEIEQLYRDGGVFI